MLLAAAAATLLSCALEAVPPYRAGEPVPVRLRLRNRGRAPVAVLDWNTPLEGLLADMFVIRREDGTGVTWNGPSIKRGDPAAGDYVTIAAGREVTENVDLALGYDLQAPGRYTVELRELRLHDVASPAQVPRPRSRHQARSLDCGRLEILIR